MKTIVLNASPRKNMNTAQLLKEAARGAESVGAEVEYHDLYDMSFTGCRSCMACKRLDAQPQHCYWKDDLSPLIDAIYQADALIVGSPIYLMDTSAQFHALLERLAFVNMSYGRPVPFHGRVNVGGIFTMNADPQWYHGRIEERLKEQLSWLRGMNGKIMLLPSLDTLQVKDYSKYNMGYFDAAHKQKVHETQFPRDMEKAYELGRALCR